MPLSFPAFVRTTLSVPFLVLALRSQAQAAPAVTVQPAYAGFQLPSIGGTLRYSLTGSESLVFGYNGQAGTGTNALTDISGNLAYLSKSEQHPFSAIYTGGYLFGDSNEPSYAFHNLALSQVAKTKNWNFVLADQISYLPQTPDVGLSGIPGVGDVGLSPVSTATESGLELLTDYGTRVTNSVSGTASRVLTPTDSLAFTGGYAIQRFISNGSDGINNDQVTGAANYNHRLNALSSLGVGYSYANSSFSGSTLQQDLSYNTQSIFVSYSRQMNRKFSFALSGGPQRTGGSGTAAVSAPSTNLSASASGNYMGKVYSQSIAYVRGVNNGTGVVVGTRSDAINYGVSRNFARVWNASGTVGFNHSTSLPNSIFSPFSSTAEVAGAQLARQFSKVFSGFASYTLQRQSFNGTSTGITPFNGLSQIVSFGVTYAPGPLLGGR